MDLANATLMRGDAIAIPSSPDFASNLYDASELALRQVHSKSLTDARWDARKAALR